MQPDLNSEWPKLKHTCWNVMNEAAGYSPSSTLHGMACQSHTLLPAQRQNIR